jgi:2-methylisocitrate lyase-like PEP mutase family enzyme
MGFPDGERVSCSAMLEAVGRIVSAVSLPVTADMEAGFGQTAEAVAAIVEAMAAFAHGDSTLLSTHYPIHVAV